MIAGLRSLEFVSFGVPFRLSAGSDELLARMQRCLPFGAQVRHRSQEAAGNFAVVGGLEANEFRLQVEGESVAEGAALEVILDRLSSELMVHVANHAVDRVFVHAGVVGWSGNALILPGTSFAGKTTLVAELIRAGASYYSDEYAVLDERGRVHPYGRDLRVREVGGAKQRSVTVGQFDGSAGTVPLPVSHVVFTEYVKEGVWSPQPVSPGSGRAGDDAARDTGATHSGSRDGDTGKGDGECNGIAQPARRGE